MIILINSVLLLPCNSSISLSFHSNSTIKPELMNTITPLQQQMFIFQLNWMKFKWIRCSCRRLRRTGAPWRSFRTWRWSSAKRWPSPRWKEESTPSATCTTSITPSSWWTPAASTTSWPPIAPIGRWVPASTDGSTTPANTIPPSSLRSLSLT